MDRDGGFIRTGPFGSQLHQRDYTDEGVPVIMPKDISDGRVSIDGVARVSEETADRLSRHQLKPRAIVLPRRGDIGKRAFIKEDQDGWLCGTGCLQIGLQGKCLLPEFLYYFMEQSYTVRWLEQFAVGVTMLNLSAEIVAMLPVRYPGIPVQRRIAETLSAYDDLIENNRRRMKLLEDAARLLYQEWFVRFRFPGHGRVRIRDGVPEGWESKPIGEVAVLNYGKALKEEDRQEGAVPVYGSSGVVGYHDKALVEGPGIVVGRKGNAGNVFWSDLPFWPIDTVYFVSPEVSTYYLYHCLQHVPFQSTDVAVPGLNRTYAHSLRILVPSTTIHSEFERAVEPMYGQMTKLRTMNDKLRAARGLLLPRLMSGEMEVRESA
jgi:type I restriction enzyme S subunit